VGIGGNQYWKTYNFTRWTYSTPFGGVVAMKKGGKGFLLFFVNEFLSVVRKKN
jgi:hypothetical protein